MAFVRVTIEFDHIPQFSEAMGDAVGRAVRKAAFDIEARAKKYSPVRTSKLKNSNYTDPDVGPYEAYVGNSAEYADYVNFGTRYMEARPFFSNATEEVRSRFAGLMSSAIRDAMG